MKKCSNPKCLHKDELQPLSKFYTYKRKGVVKYFARCKICCDKADAKRKNERYRTDENFRKNRIKSQIDWQKRNPEKSKVHKEKWRKKNPNYQKEYRECREGKISKTITGLREEIKELKKQLNNKS